MLHDGLVREQCQEALRPKRRGAVEGCEISESAEKRPGLPCNRLLCNMLIMKSHKVHRVIERYLDI